ncbi:hypothetical protein B296_00008743 [Ensete ventricosum]|uniref:Uncharacterized protein n=1 Tax=Ensete ventricosum TaxID=4639 RepID=A0A427AAW0_ENSVE|nr:hypothetical protein B296_00008743 [Ensete ventricosum]
MVKPLIGVARPPVAKAASRGGTYGHSARGAAYGQIDPPPTGEVPTGTTLARSGCHSRALVVAHGQRQSSMGHSTTTCEGVVTTIARVRARSRRMVMWRGSDETDDDEINDMKMHRCTHRSYYEPLARGSFRGQRRLLDIDSIIQELFYTFAATIGSEGSAAAGEGRPPGGLVAYRGGVRTLAESGIVGRPRPDIRLAKRRS